MSDNQNPVKRKRLYDYLNSEGMTTLSYDDFSVEYSSNAEKQGKLYSYLKDNDMTTLDSHSFGREYFGDLKKKESTEGISQENQSDSQSQVQEAQGTLDTEEPKKGSESATSIGEQSNVVELSDSEAGLIPVDSKIKEGSVNLTEAKAWVDFNTTLSVEEEEDVDKEFEEEYNNEGFFNTMTSVLKEAWNQKVGRDSAFSIDTNTLTDEIKKANELLVEEGKEVNSVSLREKTKEVYTEKKKSDLIQSKTNEALGKLPVEIKDKLGVKNREDYKSVSAERVDLVNSIKIKELEFSQAKEVVDSLEGNIASQDDVDEYNRNVSIMRDSKESVLSMFDKLAKSQENITDLDEEFDNLKRSYSSWDNFSGKFLTSSVRAFGQGGLGFIEWTNDVRKSIMGDDGLSYMPAGVIPVPTPLMEAKNKEIEIWAEEKEEGLRKSLNEMNSISDLIDTTVDVVAVQGPNMLPFFLGGGAGIAITGATALGGKTSEMKNSDKYFTENQLIFAPLLSGGATASLGAIPTARVFARSKGLFKEALKSKGGDVLLKESKSKVIKKIGETYGKNLIEEIPTEVADQIVQNVIDIDLLDNPNNISYDEGLDVVVRDTGLFTTVMSAFPLAGGVVKKVLPKSHSEKLNKNAFDIVKLRNQLNLTEDAVLIKDIEGRIENKLNQNKELLKKATNNIDNTPTELMDKVLSNDKEMVSLRGIAESIKKSNLSTEDKTERLNELKVQFNNLSEFNDRVLNGESNVLEAINPKEALKLKDKAEKELSKEKVAKGEEDFTIDDSEITERAIRLYEENKEVNKLKEELKNEEKSEKSETTVNESESETGDVQDIESKQESEPTNTQEEGDGGSIESIKEMDLTNEESKSKVVKFLEDAEVVLDDLDTKLKKQGSENLNMGLPIVATRVAVKAMKVAVVSAKTGVEVIEAGIKAVEGSAWYKNLSNDKRKEFDDNAFQIVSDNITKEVGKQVRNKQESEFSSSIEKKRKVAKRNIKKGKIGNIRGDFSVYSDFVSVPLSAVPKHLVKKYKGIIEMLGARDKVIDIKDDTKTRKDIQEIIDAVDEENIVVSSLRLQYDNFKEQNPTITKFKDIVKALRDNEVITEDDAVLMTKRKNSFVSKESRGSNKKDIEETRVGLKSKVSKVKSKEGNTRRELENLRKIKDLTTEDIDGLSDSEVRHLDASLDQIISRGKMPSVVQDILRSIESKRKGKVLVKELPNIKVKWYHLKTKLKRVLKNAFTKGHITDQKQRVMQVDLHEIDSQLGNKGNRNIFKAVFGNLARKYALYETKISNIASTLEYSLDSLGSGNKGVVSGMKITMYMIAKYKQSNPDVKSIFSVSEYVNKTVNLSDQKHISNKTKDVLKETYEGFIVKDSDGNESAEGMYEKLSAKEKKAVEVLRRELDKQIEDAYDTNLFDNNNASLFYKDYFPLNSISMDFESDLKSKMNRFNNFSSASGNLKELTATSAHGISFNPFDTVFKSIKSTSFQNEFMHETRVAGKMFRDLDNDNSISREDRGIIKSIFDVYETQIDSLVGKGFGGDQSSELFNSLSSAIKRNAYRFMLGGVARASNEFLSNLVTVTVGYIEFLPTGMRQLLEITGASRFSRSKDLRDILIYLGCTQVDRFTNPSINNVGRVDFDVNSSIKSIGQSNIDEGVVGIVKKVYRKSGVGKYSESVASIHDALISFPDTTTSLPVWLGKFSKTFKELTGSEIDFDKVKSNDRAYFDKYHKEISKASENANVAIKRIASSKNKFEGAVAVKGVGVYQTYREYNNFFRSFMKNEYMTAKIAVNDLVYNGEMSKTEASRLLVAILGRQIAYGFGVKSISGLIYGAVASQMGYGEEDDKRSIKEERDNLMNLLEGDKEYVDLIMGVNKYYSKGSDTSSQLLNAVLNTGTGIVVGAGGNTTAHVVNTSLEYVNYLYGEGFTREEGEEYDRFENGVFRAFIPVDKPSKSEFLKSSVKALSGAHSPMVESVLDLNGFGLSSNLNLVPLAKDVKGLKNYLKYDTHSGKDSNLIALVETSIPSFVRDYVLNYKEAMTESDMRKVLSNSGLSKKDVDDFIKDIKDLKIKIDSIDISEE